MTVNNNNIVFECVGFFSTPVFYRLPCGYLYHFGYRDNFKGFEPYDGFLSRDKQKPTTLPTKEEVEEEYNRVFNGKSWINPDVVRAG